MEKGRRYITLNRNREWKRSILLNLQPRDNQLVFAERPEHEQGILAAGVIITGSIDSTEQDFHWQNIILDADIPENSVIKVSSYASDRPEVWLGNNLVNLDTYIRAGSGYGPAGLNELSALFRQSFTGSTDGLLRVRGRYLWLKLEFLVPQPERFSLRKIKLLLAEEKIIHYLPEIYQNNQADNDFFQRFMEIFDSLFFEIEDEVTRIPETLNFTRAQGEMLRYLASWVSIQEVRRLDDEGLRQRIAGIMPEYARIGTKQGIEHLVERELGVKPRIIEYFHYQHMLFQGRDKELYNELFGTNPYKFYLMLPETVFRQKIMSNFLTILKQNIPAHTEAEIILLKNGIILGKHTYLGVNSMVGEYNYVSIDETVAISDDTLIGGSVHEK
ncbi:phage tail protein [Desulfosporosinus sp. PR]|uniref:phage tail protein n=1 Tax=Candidatus Desulfosporosinus nitrosoreducens TaxID=3401928 RepID=UPI0027FA5307|nr:phage tail protein [Desulfosporosinus sp. PR]MDQ7096751.1 phage tail protein [Desulfosporosinus sp. PR]